MANKSPLPTQENLPGTDTEQARRRSDLNRILAPVLMSVSGKLPDDEILASISTGGEPVTVLRQYLCSVGCDEIANSIIELIEKGNYGK